MMQSPSSLARCMPFQWRLLAEFALPVDQTLCAQAPYFLGNVPSTVTATIVAERDSMGWGRERSAFFGFGAAESAQFADGWRPSADFAEQYAPAPTGCGMLR